MGARKTKTIEEAICSLSRLYWYLLWLNVAFLLLGAFAWFYTSSGTPGAAILKVDIAINISLIVLTGALLAYCGTD